LGFRISFAESGGEVRRWLIKVKIERRIDLLPERVVRTEIRRMRMR
jgi:hypothetical protein